MGKKYRRYTYDDWKKAMDLHNKYKFGPRRISRILGIPRKTIENWLYRGVVPPSAKWVAKPCIELAYVIGVINGDGNVSKSKNKLGYEYRIELETIDPEFGIVFSKAMSKLLNRKYEEPRWKKKKKIWRVVYQSKAFYIWYKRIYMV